MPLFGFEVKGTISFQRQTIVTFYIPKYIETGTNNAYFLYLYRRPLVQTYTYKQSPLLES